MISLAVKYRPKTFDQVAEQSATKVILQQQLETGDIQNAYLFCGGAGTGKTTCARIFANEINKGKGTPVELDAASNNSVDDVRDIIKQAKLTSLDAEYNIFIMDEVHALSNQAWQAMLKILEEPPAKSIFILCTTDPQKIPKTILSRVQRYNFQRISTGAIEDRLAFIVSEENVGGDTKEQTDKSEEAIKYIAKLANGGMRDAITTLDKCLAYSTDLTIENVVTALGLSDYDTMCRFLSSIVEVDNTKQIEIINEVYMAGKDLKQFIKDFTYFVVDCCKFNLGASDYITCPDTDDIMSAFKKVDLTDSTSLLNSLIRLQTDIKWDTNPLARIEAWCITKE